MSESQDKKTKEWYDIRIRELEAQLKDANDALKKANDAMALKRTGDAQLLIEEIVKRSSFTVDELKDKSPEELLIIRTSLDKVARGKGIQHGNAADVKPDTGLTAGRWDASKKEWVT
jgi:hypothetical protein